MKENNIPKFAADKIAEVYFGVIQILGDKITKTTGESKSGFSEKTEIGFDRAMKEITNIFDNFAAEKNPQDELISMVLNHYKEELVLEIEKKSNYSYRGSKAEEVALQYFKEYQSIVNAKARELDEKSIKMN